MLFGFELGGERSRNRRMTAIFLGSNIVPVSDPTVDAEVDLRPLPSDANNRVHANVAALYAQDQIRPADWLEIVGGCASTASRSTSMTSRGRRPLQPTDHLWSPRLGLVLKPSDNLSLYASYSRSFLPQSGDQFSSLTSITEGLKPERFDNYEVGAKLQLPGGLLATAAIYQLDRTNTRASDPLDPARTVLTGAQRSRGLELGLERSINSRWLVSAGYALQKAEISETTAAAPEGREVPLVPRHSFSLWNRYDVTQQLGVGLGVIARSKSYATISNAVKLPGYARVDAALFYALPGGIEAQVNVENLFGAHYFPTANADNNIAPGAPRTLKAIARLSLLAREFLRARLDALQVADEQGAFLVACAPPRGCGAGSSGAPSPSIRCHQRAAAVPRAPSQMVTGLPTSERAAVAPSATVTGGRISSRSCSIHQRHASISPAPGLLWMRFFPRWHELEMLDRIGDVDRRALDARLSPARHRTIGPPGRRTAARRRPPGRPAARRRT